MAVLFPKKVPAFSRALGETDDCFDCEQDPSGDVTIKQNQISSINNPITELFIGIGRNQCDSLKAVLDFSQGKLLADLNVQLSGFPLIQCNAFQFGSSCVVWLCEASECENYLGSQSWVDSLLSSFSYSDTVSVSILTEKPSSCFQGSAQFAPPFMGVLKTPNASPANCTDLKAIEQPNIISGIAADVMTRCFYRGFSTCLYVTYYENLRGSSVKNDVLTTTLALLTSMPELEIFCLKDHTLLTKNCSTFEQMYI